jgi:hypothetical protein
LADNTQVTAGSGDIIASDDLATLNGGASGSVKVQRVKVGYGADSDLNDVTATVPLPISINAANFIFSSVNSSTAQLAAGATFTGTVEDLRSQPAISILLTSDQPGILKIFQYTDASGLVLDQTWTINTAASPAQQTALSRTINANYIKVSWQNAGGGTTTTLNLNTAYGTIPAATNLGNGPVSIEEIGGVAVSGSLPVTLGSATLSTRDVALQNALTNDQPIGTFLTGDPNGNYPGVNLLESMLDGDLQLPVNTPDLAKGGSNRGLQMADMAGPYIGVASAQLPNWTTPVETTGYASFSILCGGGSGSAIVQGSEDGMTWLTLPTLWAGATSGFSMSNQAFTLTAPLVGYGPCPLRFIRANLIQYTSGACQAILRLRAGPVAPIHPTTITNAQIVNSTGTALMVTEDGVGTTSFHGTGGVVRNAVTATTIVAGDAIRATYQSSGAQIVKLHSVAGADWQNTLTLTTTTAQAAKAAGAASIKNFVTGIQFQNTNATATTLLIVDGAATIWQVSLPASMTTPLGFTFDTPLQGTAATAMNVNCGTTGANVLVNIQGYQATSL